MVGWVPRCMFESSVHTLINVANMDYPSYRGPHPLNSSYFSNTTRRGGFPHVTLPSPFLVIASHSLSRFTLANPLLPRVHADFFASKQVPCTYLLLLVYLFFTFFISEGTWVRIKIFSVVTVLMSLGASCDGGALLC